MMKHSLIGGGCVHASIGGNDPRTAYMLVHKFRHVIDFAADDHPMPIFSIVVHDKVGDIVELAFLSVAAVGGEDVLKITAFSHQGAEKYVDLFFTAARKPTHNILECLHNRGGKPGTPTNVKDSLASAILFAA